MSSYYVKNNSVVAGAKNHISVLTIVITSHVPGANHPITEVDEKKSFPRVSSEYLPNVLGKGAKVVPM